MKEQELFDCLRALPKKVMADHTRLLTSDLPEFLGLLGYGRSTIFFEFLLSLSHRVKADALVSEHRTGLPWIIVEVKTFQAMRERPTQIWSAVKNSYRQFLEVEDQWLVLFSPKVLGIASKSREYVYDLTQLTEEQSSEIYSLLRRPAKSPDDLSEQPSGLGTGVPL